ncbi:nucleotidyltransferase domain-containing protein [Micromonospora avicenniae]|uniref:nucleotidyltransferase domain-containing protein n=1 Tax=Micromonospora avicenniae TaxID=1198245 RepID=UPI0034280CDB
MTCADLFVGDSVDRAHLLEEAAVTVKDTWRTSDIIVYGSVLRRDFRGDSDIDLLVLDENLNAPYRSTFHVGDTIASVNVAPTSIVLGDALGHTCGGYYAGKFALPVLALSHRSSIVAGQTRKLLVRAVSANISPVQAAMALFPAYRAFILNKVMLTWPPGPLRLSSLAAHERLMLARFRAEGERMHPKEPGWWQCYKARVGMPVGWG